MGLLDVYLQKNGKKRYDVYKNTGVSQQLLSIVNKKEVNQFSVKTVEAIAATVGKSPGEVLNEMIKLEKENPIFEVSSTEELLFAFENKEERILIKGEYTKELEEIAKSQLTENETMGAELGSSGTAAIFTEVVYQLINLFSKQDEDMKKIESQMRKYKMKKQGENEILLYLKQLDY